MNPRDFLIILRARYKIALLVLALVIVGACGQPESADALCPRDPGDGGHSLA
jgi:hypothetical protein